MREKTIAHRPIKRRDKSNGSGPRVAQGLKDGPTEGRLPCNPVGYWREVGIAGFPFRTGTFARKRIGVALTGAMAPPVTATVNALKHGRGYTPPNLDAI